MRKFLICLSVLLFSTAFENSVHSQDLADKLSMLEIVISNLVTRVEVLEKRINALEKNISSGALKVPKRGIPGNETMKPSQPSLRDGFEDIGDGFFVRNVRFNPFGSNVLFTGEMANRSEKNYRFAKFNLEIYDDRDLLVKKEEFTIPDIPKDSIKPFESMIIGVESSLIQRYKISMAK